MATAGSNTSRALSADALRGQLRSVQAALAPLRKSAADASRQQKKYRPQGLSPYEEPLVVAVYIFSSFNTSLAASKWLAIRKSSSEALSDLQAERLVEDFYIKLPDNFTADLHYPPNAAMQRLAAAARTYIAEHDSFL